MKLSKLHESYLKTAEMPLFATHKLPVVPKQQNNVIIPTSKWMNNDGCLEKTYHFLSIKIRNQFIADILEYEESVGHNATMFIKERSIELSLTTKDTDKISELDKEYARHADLVY